MSQVEETIEFIRQCVKGRCDRLDLMAIRDAIDAALDTLTIQTCTRPLPMQWEWVAEGEGWGNPVRSP
jgi:hypothetical protein